MYRILTKLHTVADNIWAFHNVLNDKEEKVLYGTDSYDDAQATAESILACVGYEDVKIVNDGPFYVSVVEGEKPVPEVATYKVEMVENERCVFTPTMIEDIKAGSSINIGLTFEEIVPSFHLIINEKEYTDGLPEWITFKALSATTGILYFNDINENYTIEVVID